MDHRLVEGLMEAIAPVIRDSLTAHVEKATAPLILRLAELDARAPEKGEPGLNGKDGADGRDGEKGATVEEVITALNPTEEGIYSPIKAVVADYMRQCPPAPGHDGADGKSVTVDDLRPLIEAEVAKIPVPKDGAPGQPGDIALAPDDIVDQVTFAVRLLAESPAIKTAEISLAVDAPSKKSFRFERDDQNRIVAAHEGEEA